MTYNSFQWNEHLPKPTYLDSFPHLRHAHNQVRHHTSVQREYSFRQGRRTHRVSNLRIQTKHTENQVKSGLECLAALLLRM